MGVRCYYIALSLVIAGFGREFSSLKSRIQDVVQIFDIIKENGEISSIIEEYIDGPDVHEANEIVKDSNSFLKALWQIASGISDIHNAGVIHRDIKPNNMKVDPEGIIKIFDFGLSRSSDENSTVGYKGTPLFSAPELFTDGKHYFSKAIDTYAFAVTALTLVKTPLNKYFVAPGLPLSPTSTAHLPGDLPDEIKTLIKKCLLEEPEQRPEMNMVRAAIERHLLYDRHRALLVFKKQTKFLDSSNRRVTLNINGTGSITIYYDGISFSVSNVSGEVTINNGPVHVGDEIKGSIVISIGGSLRHYTQRAHVTFDVSHPGVVL
ncbi:serine/threonine-protein kinase [Marinobacter nauticus]|uniref:Serine/threonine-protein kinase n=1 Tax=Marinobacter nauticus TaxID=2743 RepID=A0A368XLN8_MARNT|nr:protein kinase [Marinobacter nauticus]RCW68479.1 serine/threonine-protein kinase [Marinobacter nauticus]